MAWGIEMITDICRQPGGGPGLRVNAMDKERLKDSAAPRRRSSFGLSRTDNVNHLCIQLFHSALNEMGTAGLRLVKGPCAANNP
jgi:hypothetical protein